jgi:hypothetical protein
MNRWRLCPACGGACFVLWLIDYSSFENGPCCVLCEAGRQVVKRRLENTTRA